MTDEAWELLKWLERHVKTGRRNNFPAHFGVHGKTDRDRDTVPGTTIKMHSVNMTVSGFSPRVYLLFTGRETREEFQTAIAYLHMHDRHEIMVLYS